MMRDADVEQRVEELKAWDRATLVEEWARIQGQAPPKHASPQFMMRVISCHWQEKFYGGLSGRIKRKISFLVKQYKENPSAFLATSPQIKMGTILRRLWQGRVYEAMVVPDGFSYDGTVYTSLSEIARVITGAKWNGNLFFGLCKRRGEEL